MSTDTTPDTTPAMPDVSAMLAAATLPAIPEGVEKYLAEQIGYFAAKNTNRRTLTMTAELAPFILANRPDSLSLPESEQVAAAAKEFANQVKTFASEHGLSCYPKRVASTVTFRMNKPSVKTANPVTVTNVADAA
jgi:hypothetical protein